jgi:hypothetical protein
MCWLAGLKKDMTEPLFALGGESPGFAEKINTQGCLCLFGGV